MNKMKLVVSTMICAATLGLAATPSLAAERNPLHPNYRVMDADGDGKVAAGEFMTYMTKLWDEIQADPNPLHPSYISPAQFKDIDSNADRKISQDEFMTYVKACWNAMDKDGKGVIAESTYSSSSNNPLHPNFRN